MNTTSRVMAFGLVSGLIWSAIAAMLSGLDESVTFAISGILTGLLVSFVLKSPLQKYGRWSGFVFGAISLPFGAFVFGIVVSVVQLVASRITGSGDFPFGRGSDPIETGLTYAILSVVSLFVVALLPLSVLTTFLLRAVIHRHKNAA